jgi:hypothetical protein
VTRLQQQQAATALETIEQVLASLALIPDRDHALEALITAIETDRNSLAARLHETSGLRWQ